MLDLQLWMNESPMGGCSLPPSKHLRFIIDGEKSVLKPTDAFWTSTAIKSQDGYTSDWVQWVSQEMPKWLSKTGYLFKVKPTARILRIETDADAETIYHKFLGKEIPSHYDAFDRKWHIIKYFPWKLISAQYDGIHYYPTEAMPIIMRNWDCESTVWFDMNVLQQVGEVKIVL